MAGEFCPEGSSHPTPCTPGHFCAVDFMNDTSGECDPGYYCTASAKVANPNDGNVTGTLFLFYFISFNYLFIYLLDIYLLVY